MPKYLLITVARSPNLCGIYSTFIVKSRVPLQFPDQPYFLFLYHYLCFSNIFYYKKLTEISNSLLHHSHIVNIAILISEQLNNTEHVLTLFSYFSKAKGLKLYFNTTGYISLERYLQARTLCRVSTYSFYLQNKLKTVQQVSALLCTGKLMKTKNFFQNKIF